MDVLKRRVSVVVPTRNRPHYLKQSLASIRAIEGPDLDLEVIVADNGHVPQTCGMAESFGAKYITVGGEGASVARNAALKVATGDYIAFLDDDDAWLPTHLRKHLEFLEQRPDMDAVIGQVISADPNLNPVGEPWPAEPIPEGETLLRTMLSGYFPQIGSVVIRACVPKTIGYFDERLIGGEDLDWLLRLARRNKIGVIKTQSVLFRGRPLGTFDDLQIARTYFDREVFLRHAVLAWRIWKSPLQFMNAWYGTLRHFYRYFVDTAARRAARGERLAALQAIWCAFQVFPYGRSTIW